MIEYLAIFILQIIWLWYLFTKSTFHIVDDLSNRFYQDTMSIVHGQNLIEIHTKWKSIRYSLDHYFWLEALYV